jgi:hypothetical protein
LSGEAQESDDQRHPDPRREADAANELEKAHAFLDALGIPRGLSDADCTLAARISLLAGTPSNWTAETPNGGEWSHDTEDYFVDGNR